MMNDAVFLAWVMYVASFFIGLLLLWFVIYTAVRSALTSHRQALVKEHLAARQ